MIFIIMPLLIKIKRRLKNQNPLKERRIDQRKKKYNNNNNIYILRIFLFLSYYNYYWLSNKFMLMSSFMTRSRISIMWISCIYKIIWMVVITIRISPKT